MRRSLASLFLAVPVALAAAARADRLELADGRVVEGSVTREGSDYRVLSRFGETVLPAKDVVKWTQAKSFDVEWRERLAAIPEGRLDERAALARWLAEAGRKAEAEATASLVLETDPEHAVAHEVLGHVRFQGRWMSPDESKHAQGLVRRGDAWYTPAEWANLDPAGKKQADEAEALAVARARGAAINEALRLMVANDPNLRTEGERRILRMAKEEDSKEAAKELEDLVPQVKAYAEANDRMMKTLAAVPTESSGRVLAETRIQMAKLKRPIKSITTSLASGPPGVPVSTTAGVVIQLPELEVITLKSTVLIPTR
jgi:hypothetical protein